MEDVDDIQSDTVKSMWRRVLDRSPREPYNGSSPSHAPLGEPLPSSGFSGSKAASIVGITYRQLDYWTRTGLVRPTHDDDAAGRLYSYLDLLELRLIKTLLDAGLKLEAVRDVVGYLRDHDVEMRSANIVVSGNSVVLATDDELVDVLKRGQGVLNVLSVVSVKQQLDHQIAVDLAERTQRLA